MSLEIIRKIYITTSELTVGETDKSPHLGQGLPASEGQRTTADIPRAGDPKLTRQAPNVHQRELD